MTERRERWLSMIRIEPHVSLIGIARTFPMTWWTICANIGLALLMGLIFLFSDGARFSSPAYEQARRLMGFLPDPMKGWGVLFIALGVAQIVMMRLSLKWLARICRTTGTVWMFYGILSLGAALSSPLASFGGFVIYVYIAVIHFAAASTVNMLEAARE